MAIEQTEEQRRATFEAAGIADRNAAVAAQGRSFNIPNYNALTTEQKTRFEKGELTQEEIVGSQTGVARSATLSDSPAGVDIRKDVESRASERLAAINKVFEDVVRRRQEAETRQLAQQRGINVRSGLAGSSFAPQQKEPIREAAAQDIETIRAKQALAVQDLQRGIEEDIRAEEERGFKGEKAAQDRLTFQQGQVDRARGLIKEKVLNAAQSEVSPDEFLKSKLAQEAIGRGFDENELKGMFIGALPSAKVIGSPIKSGSKVTYLVEDRSKPNGVNAVTIDVPGVDLEDPDNQVVKGDDGVIYTINKATGKVVGQVGAAGPAKRTAAEESVDRRKEDFEKAQKFIRDNPEASEEELEKGIRGNTSELSEGDIKSLLPKKQFLTKDYFKSVFTEDQLKTSAKEAGFTAGGFLGFGVGQKGIDDYLKYLEGLVEQYRKANYSDQEILKLMQ